MSASSRSQSPPPPRAARRPLEPRFFARAALDARLVLSLEGRTIEGRTVNVSEGGVRADLVEEVPAGALALLEIELPGEPGPTSGVVEIIWCRPEGPPERPHAVGLAYVELDDADAEVLRRFVEQSEPLFWE